ncbi:MAG: DsrE/DsrF/DrsH-like family protein [Promethearchaeota archaeon]
MAGPKKMAIIVSKSNLDMAYPPFILGVTGAGMDMDVSLFFTFWGMNLLKKGGAKKAKLPGMMRIGTGMIRRRMKGVGAPTLPDIIKQAKELGAKLYACQMTMDVMKIKREDLIPEVDDVVGAATFLNIAKDADITLFI